MIEITYKQKLWLRSRGGRSRKDVIMFEGNISVLMNDGHGNLYPVFIPNDPAIHLYLDTKGYVQDRFLEKDI